LTVLLLVSVLKLRFVASDVLALVFWLMLVIVPELMFVFWLMLVIVPVFWLMLVFVDVLTLLLLFVFSDVLVLAFTLLFVLTDVLVLSLVLKFVLVFVDVLADVLLLLFVFVDVLVELLLFVLVLVLSDVLVVVVVYTYSVGATDTGAVCASATLHQPRDTRTQYLLFITDPPSLPICLVIQFILNPAQVYHHLVELLIDSVEPLFTKAKARFHEGEPVIEIHPYRYQAPDEADNGDYGIDVDVHYRRFRSL